GELDGGAERFYVDAAGGAVGDDAGDGPVGAGEAEARARGRAGDLGTPGAGGEHPRPGRDAADDGAEGVPQEGVGGEVLVPGAAAAETAQSSALVRGQHR